MSAVAERMRLDEPRGASAEPHQPMETARQELRPPELRCNVTPLFSAKRTIHVSVSARLFS